MEVLNKDKVASVALLDVRLSEDEIALYQSVLSYILDAMSADEVELRFGASVDEVEGIRDDLREALAEHGDSIDHPVLAQTE
jgi:hypothetical protein